jgi:hypothetical protein
MATSRPTPVSLDTTRMTKLLKKLGDQADDVDLDKAGKKALETVKLQQARQTGRLARSVKVVTVDKSHVKIASDAPYASFNWLGTSRQAAKPPEFDYRPSELAEDVSRQIFSVGSTPS